ncbi:MAG TPA: DUF488 family protein, partial [Nitrospiria bacterium]|nr:DUF488 family protein [Nitrospiria bacterium]
YKMKLKRIYEAAERTDGFRILVDRLWPRGVSKEKARIDLWMKDIAPSHELRKWFNHDPQKWVEFLQRYEKELQAKQSQIRDLKQKLREEKVVTLLFSASDEKYNNAVALKRLLK